MTTYRRNPVASDPPPSAPTRHLALRPGVSRAAGWARAALPVLFVSFLLARLALCVATMAAGTEVRGQVVGTSLLERNGQRSVNVSYRYEGRAQRYSTWGRGYSWTIEPPPELTFRVGDPVRVRYVDLGLVHEELMLLPGESPWAMAPFLLVIGLAVGAIGSLFTYFYLYLPWRERWLYRRGCRAQGRLTGLRTRQISGLKYWADYEFTTIAGETVVDAAPVASQTLWESAQVGQAVTVLHAPRQAKPSLVYELGAYEWVAAKAPGAEPPSSARATLTPRRPTSASR